MTIRALIFVGAALLMQGCGLGVPFVIYSVTDATPAITSQATVTYLTPDGPQTRTVVLPWAETIKVKNGDPLSLTATSADGPGQGGDF